MNGSATLTYAGAVYRDTLPLALGMVEPSRLELAYRVHQVEELLTSADAHLRHDLTEFSLGRLVSLTREEPGRWVGLPIFPARAFRHSAVYVAAGSPLTGPEQLGGRRVGVPRWTQTAGVWTRGILADRYGVDLRSVRWVLTARVLSAAGRLAEERRDAGAPAGFDLQASASEATLHEQLLRGDVDAVISANPLPTGPDAPFRQLVEDVDEAERAYFLETGLFPIMHVVVAERARLAEDPGLASAVVDAFERSRRLAEAQWGASTAVPFTGLAWENVYRTRERRILDGGAWQHGLGSRNEACLKAFLRYAIEQGICASDVGLADLFWASDSNHDGNGGTA